MEGRLVIDKEALLAWLEPRTGTDRKPLVAAIYAGLRDRIQRGDFDTKESE
jgi:hypothetical protein